MSYKEFRKEGIIFIPKKIRTTIEKLDDDLLNQVNENDRLYAKEACYYLGHLLLRTYYNQLRNELEKDTYRKLNSKILKKQLGKNYRRVFDLMLDLDLIEENPTYVPKKESKKFRVSPSILASKLEMYKIENEVFLKRLKEVNKRNLKEALSNPIASYLIEYVYPFIELPSINFLKERGKELVKQGKRTPKGKKLVRRNKRGVPATLKRVDERCIEDDISLYKSLTERGILTPKVGSEKSGGRVVDSFTLMPKWIRQEVKIKGESLVELDYKCLHPNIAIKLFSPKKEMVSHELIEDEIGELDSKKSIKIEHLTYFNATFGHFLNSPLHKFYEKRFPIMTSQIVEAKRINHKSISWEIFSEEVRLMTKVVKRFRLEGIKAIYVYDALLVEPIHTDQAKFIMNQIVNEMGIITEVG